MSDSPARWRSVLNFFILTVLIAVLFAPVLISLMERWWKDSDYGHGFLVPVFSAFLLWRNRSWTRIRPEPNAWGLGVITSSVLLLIAGSIAAEVFVSRVSLVLLLYGVALYFAGWKMLRSLVFPLGFLLFMIPLPAIIYYQITFPLQLLSSRLVAWTLQLVSIPVLREGNLLILPNYTLDVVEACSGIRSLIALVTLAVADGYFVGKRLWIRLVMVILIFPIAVFTNSVRISIAGVLTYTLGPASAEGYFHQFEGLITFFVALVLLFLAHSILRRFGRPEGKIANA
jgi:exosortase